MNKQDISHTFIDTYTKLCKSEQAYCRELEVYAKALPFTPKLLAAHPPGTLILEKLDAIPYLDYAEGFNPELLAETLAAFHLAFQNGDRTLCHHDNQPGNILFNGKQYYFIDFSDSLYENPLHDITHLLLFWAEEFETSLFGGLCHRFMAQYLSQNSIATGSFTHYLQANIIRFDERRNRYCKRQARNPARTIENRNLLLKLQA